MGFCHGCFVVCGVFCWFVLVLWGWLWCRGCCPWCRGCCPCGRAFASGGCSRWVLLVVLSVRFSVAGCGSWCAGAAVALTGGAHLVRALAWAWPRLFLGGQERLLSCNHDYRIRKDALRDDPLTQLCGKPPIFLYAAHAPAPHTAYVPALDGRIARQNQSLTHAAIRRAVQPDH